MSAQYWIETYVHRIHFGKNIKNDDKMLDLKKKTAKKLLSCPKGCEFHANKYPKQKMQRPK